MRDKSIPQGAAEKQRELPLKFTDQVQHGKDTLRNWERRHNKLLTATLIPELRRIDRSLCD